MTCGGGKSIGLRVGRVVVSIYRRFAEDLWVLDLPQNSRRADKSIDCS